MFAARRSVFVASGSVGAVFVALGLVGHVGNGLDWRIDEELLRYINAEADIADRNCHFGPEMAPPRHPVTACVFSSTTGRIDVLLAGDSHSAAISKMLGEGLQKLDIGYYNISYSSCPPMTGLRRFNADAQRPNIMCTDFIEGLYDYASNPGITPARNMRPTETSVAAA